METFQHEKSLQKIQSEIDYIKSHLAACYESPCLSKPRSLLVENYKAMLESRQELLNEVRH